jgi:integrase
LKVCDFKILPMQPEVYQHLYHLWQKSPTKKGLIFVDPDTAGFFRYAKIQRAYNKAFRKAGLPYTSTHPMRHGGASDMLNATGGDITATQQLTDHASLGQLQVYAKRNKYALRDVVKERWKVAISEKSATPN